jgi:Transposase IS4
VENINLYAVNAKQIQVTLDEMMKFLGILFYISTVDKGEYANYWGDQIENKMFGEVSSGLDRVMTLRRFKFIRRYLSFREGVTLAELKSDPAARIRPLIKILKARAMKFVQLGRNVAVDESSVACRSKYGRHMIVYNATKPTGKYHFKIYMMCCSETWYAASFKLHCASDLDRRLDGVIDGNEIENFREATKTSTLIRKHVLEVVMPVNYSNRIVNTDNFYTSVQLLEALRVVGLYGRGTIRSDSKYGPKFLMMKKNDNMVRGSMRQGVDVNHKMVGVSWCDGSIVNILSTADASTTTTVDRMIGRSKISIPAPTCIHQYNQFMQGVDRIDQLRSRFSIADGHTFKKWHKKLAMAYIDIARCNAFVGRKLTGAYATARDPHREFMIELSSQLIHGAWESAIGDTGIMYTDPNPITAFQSPVARSPRPPSPASESSQCTMKHSSDVFPNKRDKRGCVVCRFEGRFASQQTVYCLHHKVPLCTKIRDCESVKSYICPNTKMTCWNKYHLFYFPAGLFNMNGIMRRSSALYRDMKRLETQSRVPPTICEDEELMYTSDVTDTPLINRSHRSTVDQYDTSSSSDISSVEFQPYDSDISFSDQSSIDLGAPMPLINRSIDQHDVINPSNDQPDVQPDVINRSIDQPDVVQSVEDITPGCIFLV